MLKTDFWCVLEAFKMTFFVVARYYLFYLKSYVIKNTKHNFSLVYSMWLQKYRKRKYKNLNYVK